MKKYLINGAMALVIGGFTASCSENEFEYVSTVEQKVKEFEEVFKAEFGDVDKDQCWGFEDAFADKENEEALAAARRAVTRTIASTHKFPAMPAEGDYASSVPSNATYLGDLGSDIYNSIADNGVYWVDGSVNYNMDLGKGSRITLYIKGTVRPTNLYVQANSKIYLTTGSKLVLGGGTADYSFGQSNTRVYVASGATLECEGGQLQFSNSTLYNAGVVKAKTLNLAGTSKLLNQGTVNTEGNLIPSNAGSEIVNDGTISIGGNITSEGSSHIQNNSRIIVTGRTWLNSTQNTWVNNGTWTTNDFFYESGSTNVINNCRLIVKNNMGLNNCGGTKSFKMDANSYVETRNFYAGGTKSDLTASGAVKIVMGNNSLFKVKETARMNVCQVGYNQYSPDGTDYYINGIYGVGDSYAMFQAKDVTRGDNDYRVITYGGKLNVVATNSHFTLWADEWGNKNHEFQLGFSESNLYVGGTNSSGTAAPAAPSSKCILGTDGPVVTNSKEEKEFKEKLDYGRIFCEDLGRATREDLDYNDLVFDYCIWRIWKSERTITTTTQADGTSSTSKGSWTEKSGTSYYQDSILILAAGGTLPISIAKKEVHSLFKVGTTTIVNTRDNNSTAFGEFAYKDPVLLILEKDAAYSNILDIPIVVNYAGDGTTYGTTVTQLKPERGKAPHLFRVTGHAAWPTERKNIGQAYPTFKEWVNSGSSTSTKFWSTNDPYYLYSSSHGLSDDPKGTVISTPERTTQSSSEEILWSAGASFGGMSTITAQLNSQIYYAGERIRFYGTGTDYSEEFEPPYIIVTYSDDSKPYFLDAKFPTTGIIEVKLDDTAAQKLSSGLLTIQGRKLNLSRITIDRW